MADSKTLVNPAAAAPAPTYRNIWVYGAPNITDDLSRFRWFNPSDSNRSGFSSEKQYILRWKTTPVGTYGDPSASDPIRVFADGDDINVSNLDDVAFLLNEGLWQITVDVAFETPSTVNVDDAFQLELRSIASGDSFYMLANGATVSHGTTDAAGEAPDADFGSGGDMTKFLSLQSRPLEIGENDTNPLYVVIRGGVESVSQYMTIEQLD